MSHLGRIDVEIFTEIVLVLAERCCDSISQRISRIAGSKKNATSSLKVQDSLVNFDGVLQRIASIHTPSVSSVHFEFRLVNLYRGHGQT